MQLVYSTAQADWAVMQYIPWTCHFQIITHFTLSNTTYMDSVFYKYKILKIYSKNLFNQTWNFFYDRIHNLKKNFLKSKEYSKQPQNLKIENNHESGMGLYSAYSPNLSHSD